MVKKFEWKGKFHFMGDIHDTEAWFTAPSRKGKYVSPKKPHLDFWACSKKQLKELQKLDGKKVILILKEVKKK